MKSNYKTLFLIIFLLGITHRLQEIPMWSKSTTRELRFEWMKTKWWTDSSPREDRNNINVLWADAYHFFINLTPAIICLLIGWHDWKKGIIALGIHLIAVNGSLWLLVR